MISTLVFIPSTPTLYTYINNKSSFSGEHIVSKPSKVVITGGNHANTCNKSGRIRANVERSLKRLNIKRLNLNWLHRLKPLHYRGLFSFGHDYNVHYDGIVVKQDDNQDDKGEVRLVYGENEPYPGLVELIEFVNDKYLPFDKRDWAGMYQTCMEERDMWVGPRMIEGRIPKDLVGTMFRNVPAGLHAGKHRFRHIFDGDGMICRVVFDGNGRVRWTNRYVRTEGFVRERMEQDVVYRCTFGRDTNDGVYAPLGRYQYKNVGNTNVVYWGGRLLALWENGLPYGLDPYTLDTLGLDTLGGGFRSGVTFTTGVDMLDEILRLGDSFTAHPYVYNDRLIGFNYTPTSDLNTRLGLYEFDDNWNLLVKKRVILPGITFIHDFSITENYYVVLLNALTVETLPLILGQKTPGECIRLRDRTNLQIVLIPRKDPEKLVRILQTDAHVCFHHINAYEEQDGTLVLNSLVQSGRSRLDVFSDFRFPNIDFHQTGVSNVCTFRIKPDENDFVAKETLRPNNVELGTINSKYIGMKHRYTWMCESLPLMDSRSVKHYLGSPMQVYSKIDLETGEVRQWYAGKRSFVNEPVFVPKKNAREEDDGYIVGFVFDAGRITAPGNDIVILDAKYPDRGPLAVIHLPFGVPPGLHASFEPQSFYRSYEEN